MRAKNVSHCSTELDEASLLNVIIACSGRFKTGRYFGP
jgi:hypothetical protein